LNSLKIYRLKEVRDITGLSTSSIYKQIRLGKFPPGVKITARSTGWSSEAVDGWITSRLATPVTEEVGVAPHA
jgi:prophage regulatory protein